MSIKNSLMLDSKSIGIISIVLCFVFAFLSLDYGISGDERFYEPYGQSSWSFFKTMGEDTSALFINTGDGGQLHCYGPSIDLLSGAIIDVFNIESKFEVRHVVASLVFVLLIFFTVMTARMIAGNVAAWIALLFIILSPRLFGDAMNNLKDPSYAAFNVMSLYLILRLCKELPNPSNKTIIGLIVGFGLTLGSRVGGLLLFGYMGLFLLFEIFTNKELKSKVFGDFFKPLLKRAGIVILGSYILGIIFWPFGLVSPIENPLHALDFFTNQTYQIKTFFNGAKISSMEIPASYVFKWISISVPEIIVIGGIIGSILIFMTKDKEIRKYSLMVLFTFLFPIVYIIYKKSGMYNGWRHTTFVYPSFVIIASVGYKLLLDKFNSKNTQYAIYALIGIGLLLPLKFMIANHPHQSVYFNSFSGGVKNAVGKYETDYFGVTIRKGIEELIKMEGEQLKNKKIALNYATILGDYYIQKKYPKQVINYVRYNERDNSDWDYYIVTTQLIQDDLVKNGVSFPPKGTVKTIDVDGVSLCAIVKRTDRNDYYGKKALDSQQFPKAIEFLNKALQYDPNNEIAWTNLGFAQLNSNQVNEAIQSLSNALKISPENMMAKNYLAYAYLQSGNLPYAQSVLMNLIEENPNNPEPYRLLAQIYQQQGNGAMAQQYMSYYQQIMAQMGGQ
jgi:tetratricopeptide (TPR) repeat protein